MGWLTKHTASQTDASPVRLEDLIAEAESFGRLRIYGFDAGGYGVTITFATMAGMKLEAKSDFFDHTTMLDALSLAISRAKKIREQFK